MREKRAALAHRHESTEVEAHEAGVACDHDSLRFAIDVDQARRGVCLKRSNRLLLLRRECSHCFDLIDQRTDNRPDVVIENRRKIRVSVAGQKSLKGW